MVIAKTPTQMPLRDASEPLAGLGGEAKDACETEEIVAICSN
jgi:hypothetical protein